MTQGRDVLLDDDLRRELALLPGGWGIWNQEITSCGGRLAPREFTGRWWSMLAASTPCSGGKKDLTSGAHLQAVGEKVDGLRESGLCCGPTKLRLRFLGLRVFFAGVDLEEADCSICLESISDVEVPFLRPGSRSRLVCGQQVAMLVYGRFGRPSGAASFHPCCVGFRESSSIPLQCAAEIF